MDKPSYRYGLDERPPLGENLIFGLQWLAITVPLIIILGKIVAASHFADPAAQILYLQKLFFTTAVMLLIQVYRGHRLPLITGPASVLLIGITANAGSSIDAMYTATIIGGGLLTLAGATGWLDHLKGLFPPRVVAVILLLIAFTLLPTIMNLIIAPGTGVSPPLHLLFSLAFLAVLVSISRVLTGLWKSTLIIWAMLAGSLVYFLVFSPAAVDMSGSAGAVPTFASFFHEFTLHFSLEPALIVSFLFTYLALFINDLGSMQSVGSMVGATEMQARISRGVTVTGLMNILSGFLGVIGPVNFSLSPGVIASTRCASRFTLAPTAILLFLISFFPAVIHWLGNIPPVVIGTLLLYIMCAQVATGLRIIYESENPLSMDNGYIVGLPVLLGTVISFLPPAVTAGFPAMWRPILGNGFVVGVVAVLLLEHVLFRKKG
ncbi:uracil-xanthine permease family protein [Heliomicrobium undosum]|uniref:uracil-xanthine permease family protein n=1 Tax=Heliomicrobium undosum TaxID=121734 RepID=UPI001F2DF2B7|nr:solute carrier family 23 protein [Heliomicrobium undosum]